MSQEDRRKKPRAVRFLFENSLFLIAGAVAALVWANLHPASYHHFVEFDVRVMFVDDEHASHDETGGSAAEHAEHADGKVAAATAGADGQAKHAAEDDTAHADADHGLTLHFLVNDLLMALFFAIAGKEVWEALLPGGALSNPRKAATPLLGTLGGIVGPAGLYVGGVLVAASLGLTTWRELGSGWAVPCATDIAFSYLVARIIFGPGHPAIAFLLLLAIADDAAGLVILAVFYPQKPLELWWLLLTAAAMAVAYGFQRAHMLHPRLRLHSFWWYLLIPGVMSWFSFYFCGIHAALGLIPIIPLMPHARTDLGIYAREEHGRSDTLNEFEHWWKNPVELILGMFGLVNAGVAMSNIGVGTWVVLLGLLVGKPVGITLFTWLGQKLFKLEIPGGMTYRHVVTLGMVAGIGFTVALFVSTAAFPLSKFSQNTLDAVKMGALASFSAAGFAFLVAWLLGVWPRPQEPPAAQPVEQIPAAASPVAAAAEAPADTPTAHPAG